MRKPTILPVRWSYSHHLSLRISNSNLYFWESEGETVVKYSVTAIINVGKIRKMNIRKAVGLVQVWNRTVTSQCHCLFQLADYIAKLSSLLVTSQPPACHHVHGNPVTMYFTTYHIAAGPIPTRLWSAYLHFTTSCCKNYLCTLFN